MSFQRYDGWTGRNEQNTTIGKVQKQFWFTKSALLRKLKKKEDEHVVISDSELDSRIELFKAIQSSTKELRELLCEYQTKVYTMAHEETCYGRLLKDFGKEDKTKAGEMMLSVGKCLCYTAQQRLAMRNPLIRLYQEVETFQTRAVEDTLQSVEEMEKVRTEYRGALMWMKNISQNFNPEQYQQLEKFREVQATVKRKKQVFDKYKIKCLQKIELLDASRCNMFSHALTLYQNSLDSFSKKSEKTLRTIADQFEGYHPYAFQVIKELVEPQPTPTNNDALKNQSGSMENLLLADTDVNDLIKVDDVNSGKQEKQLSNFDVDSSEKDDFLSLFSKNEQVPALIPEENIEWSSIDLYEKPLVWDNLDVSNDNKKSDPYQLLSHVLPSELLKATDGHSNRPDISTAGSIDVKQDSFKLAECDPPSAAKKETKQAPNITKEDAKKQDWYRIFQELDPLTNQNTTFYDETHESGKC